MASNIVELFGFDPTDTSDVASEKRRRGECCFVGGECVKTLSNGDKSGVCSLKPKTGTPVICCPNRLYAEDYKILQDVAQIAFGDQIKLIHGNHAMKHAMLGEDIATVAVFGKRWGGELRLPARGNIGGYFVDWILAKIRSSGEIDSFVAIEVQSIDTTGNYQAERIAYLNGEDFSGTSTAGFNWENVNKRILPQLIYKGHVLRRERLCTKGLFFVSPTQVYNKIKQRLGNGLLEYTPQSGSLSFMWYELGEFSEPGLPRKLIQRGSFITTVDQVANAFTSPSNLPPNNVYEQAIKKALLNSHS